MDSNKALYQHIVGKLRLISIMAFIIVACFVALVIFRESQLMTYQLNTEPLLSRTKIDLASLLESQKIISDVQKSTTIASLIQTKNTYTVHLNKLSRQHVLSAPLMKKFQDENQAFHSEIARLGLNADKNQQLKRSSVIQLKLLIDEFSVLVTDTNIEKNELFLQVTEDNVNDRITASRAKAFAVISEQLALYEQTFYTIKQAVGDVERLDLHYPLNKYDLLTEQLKAMLIKWRDRFDTVEQYSGANKRAIFLLMQLNELLFEQQRTVAKWRSQLRIAQAYFSIVEQHKAYMTSRLTALELPEVNPVSLLPNALNAFIAPYFPVNNNHYYGVLMGLLIIGFVIMGRLTARIKKQVMGFEAIVSADNLLENAPSMHEKKLFPGGVKELAVVRQTLQSVVVPEHSEADYKALQQSSLFQEQMLYEHLRIGFWHIDHHGQLECDFAHKLCGIEANDIFTSWRHLFDKMSVHRLLTAAKLAKATKLVQHCAVVTKNQHHAQVAIHFYESRWHGCIALTELLYEKEQLIEQLARNIDKAEAKTHQLAIESANQLSRMVVQTMLQCQNVSLGANVSSLQVYRQLTRMLDWCRQIQISNALQSKTHSLQLVDVVVRDELDAAIFNIAAECNMQRNIVSLQVAPNVLKRAKLNIRLFHRCMKGLARLLLADIFNGHLLVKFTVVDQDDGKQTINVEFDVTTEKTFADLPDVIAQLLDFSLAGDDYAPQVIRYLHLLLTANHCQNLDAILIDNGIKLAFQIPMAFASGLESYQVVEEQINFASKKMLIVSRCDYLINVVSHSLAKTNAQFEVLTNVDYFTQQISVKHMTHHHVSVVILGPELLKDHIDGVKQHLASLPSKLRPQLFVMQYPFNQLLHRVGLYQCSSTPFHQYSLQQGLNELFVSGLESNEFLPAAQFANKRFKATQVEVLLAVEQPAVHQLLFRLMHWLGLQVQFVCQPDSMLKYWQTGRFMILISEFEQSPFIKMDVGNKISRAIFTFKSQLFDQGIYGDNWQVSELPPIEDLVSLISLFSPWLNETTYSESSRKKISNQKVEPLSMVASLPTTENEELPHLLALNAELPAKALTLNAFDVIGYADNQGSPEIAGLMLEEYVSQVIDNEQQLNQALREKDQQGIQLAIHSIRSLAEILVAEELNRICQNILNALSIQDYALIKELKRELKQAIEALSLSAEAI